MTKTTKVLLSVAVISFAFGFTGLLWGVGKPIGAIFFGLFLISKTLEKETAAFDKEEKLKEQFALQSIKVTTRTSNTPATRIGSVAHQGSR